VTYPLGPVAMVCCLLCFSDADIEGDERVHYGNKWKTDMMGAFGAEPLCCIASCVCLPCAQVKLRQDALNGDMTQYKCCQGYLDNPCFTAGTKGDQGNFCCLVLEACCCPGLAVSATRFLVMDTRDISPDPCDNRLIRFSNCMQLVSCICDIAACFEPSLRDIADLTRLAADCVFLTVASCMTAQTHHELKLTPGAQPIPLNFEAVQRQQQIKFQAKFPNKQQPGGGGYPQQQAGYPQQQAGYPQQQAGYPQQQAGYPQQQAGYAQQQAGYAQPVQAQQPMYR